MNEQLVNLILTVVITLFLSGFVTLWLWRTNATDKQVQKVFIGVAKKYYAIIRLAKFGKVPTLCGTHAATLLTRKGQMALLDNTKCELCTKKSKLI